MPAAVQHTSTDNTAPPLQRLAGLARMNGRRVVIGVPFLWLIVFFLLPFAIVLKIAFSEMGAVHPNDLLTVRDGVVTLALKVGHFALIAQDALYLHAYVRSLQIAAITAALCLLIGYPFAYFMARARASVQPLLLMLVMLPFWTSFLLRVYAWKGLLSPEGWAYDFITGLGLDTLLAAAGWIPAPGKLLHSPFSLVVGMVYTYLPFMILPLYGNLAKMDLR
ncbi:MAG: ABC transporter permease, partial [Rubrivivax sp.]